MKVVLIQDVAKIGLRGDIAEVSSGYAVNFLIPRKLADAATEESIRRAKIQKREKKEKKEELGGYIESLSKRVRGKEFQIKVAASKGGRLYGSMSGEDVASALKKVWDIKRQELEVFVDLAQPIRDSGKYPLDGILSGGEVKRTVELVVSVVVE